MVAGQDLNLRPSGYEYCVKIKLHQYSCGLEGGGASSLSVDCQLRKILTPDRASFEKFPQAG